MTGGKSAFTTTATFYGLQHGHAAAVVEEVAAAVDGWQNTARQAGMAAADIVLMAGAFSAHRNTTVGLRNWLVHDDMNVESVGAGESYHLREMVAAFVQPNAPAIDRLLKGAALALQAGGKSGSIDGCTHGSKRAWELASGIWAAVLQRKLNYALPPASFEHMGQKVRSPSQVLDGGLATCLDLALLFAACLEQAHLNPLLVSPVSTLKYRKPVRCACIACTGCRVPHRCARGCKSGENRFRWGAFCLSLQFGFAPVFECLNMNK